MGVVGLLMFGDGVSEEITANILRTEGYPKFQYIVLISLIAIIPITKIPLKLVLSQNVNSKLLIHG